jgi:hypothetical protein
VLDLVPLEDRLVAETRVALTDVELVRVGQPARLRLNAFRAQELPLLDGRVIYVSADRQTDPQGGGAYFVARVEFDRASFAEHAGGAAAQRRHAGRSLPDRRAAHRFGLRAPAAARQPAAIAAGLIKQRVHNRTCCHRFGFAFGLMTRSRSR